MTKNFKQHLKIHKKRLIISGVLFFIIIIAGGITLGHSYSNKNEQITPPQTKEDTYIAFLSEVYDKIQENYWEKAAEEDLNTIFKLGVENLTKSQLTLRENDKNGLMTMLIEVIKNIEEEKQKQFTVTLAHIVLQNLKPLGRSGLYTKKDEQNLQNRIQNVNPETGQVEPTVFGKLVRPDILHLYIKKMSPTTFDELKRTADSFDSINGLDTLILDLRKNIGGSIDLLQYLLGPFIGLNQYAFEFFHQGEYTPFKTKIGWLPSLARYKKVVILIDDDVQSSGELMAATLKKYNVGVTIGTKTKGWGTIEKVFEIENQIDPNEKYSAFIVHSLALRDDGQPIETNGVQPLININDPDWKQQLFAYFNYNELIEAVEEIWNTPPDQL